MIGRTTHWRRAWRAVVCIAAAVAAGCATPTREQQPVQLVPGSVELGATTAEVPMRSLGFGVPVVAVRLEGGPTADMMVDTGCSFVVLSQDLVTRANLKTRAAGDLTASDGGGNIRKASGVARVGRLCVEPVGGSGGACFGPVDAFVTDLAPFSRGPGGRIDGLLGLPLFRNVLLTLDYTRSRVRIERAELPPPDGQEVLPIQLAAGGRVLVPFRIGPREVWANMDSGFAGGMVVPEWALPSFPGAERAVEGGDRFRFIAGVSERARVARLNEDVRIGRHVVRRPVVQVGKVNEPTIGTGYLRHFAITIDQKNRRVRFARMNPGDIFVPPVFRPGFEIDPATGAVTFVLAGGGAAGAGLRVGDRVTAVEGAPLRQFLRTGPRPGVDLDGRANTLTVDVDRAGTTMRFNIPLTVVVP